MERGAEKTCKIYRGNLGRKVERGVRNDDDDDRGRADVGAKGADVVIIEIRGRILCARHGETH